MPAKSGARHHVEPPGARPPGPPASASHSSRWPGSVGELAGQLARRVRPPGLPNTALLHRRWPRSYVVSQVVPLARPAQGDLGWQRHVDRPDRRPRRPSPSRPPRRPARARPAGRPGPPGASWPRVFHSKVTTSVSSRKCATVASISASRRVALGPAEGPVGDHAPLAEPAHHSAPCRRADCAASARPPRAAGRRRPPAAPSLHRHTVASRAAPVSPVARRPGRPASAGRPLVARNPPLGERRRPLIDVPAPSTRAGRTRRAA